MMAMARITSRVKRGPSAAPALRSSSVALAPTARADERQHHAAGGRRTTDTSSVDSSVRPRTVATAPEVRVAGARGVPEQDPVLPSKTRCFNVHYAMTSANKASLRRWRFFQRVALSSRREPSVDMASSPTTITVAASPVRLPQPKLLVSGLPSAATK